MERSASRQVVFIAQEIAIVPKLGYRLGRIINCLHSPTNNVREDHNRIRNNHTLCSSSLW